MKGSVLVHKLYEKCSESRHLGEAKQTLVSCHYLRVLSKYKNVSKKNRIL